MQRKIVMQDPKAFFSIGASSCALAVGLGAFGAHGLQDVLSSSALQTYQTATLYHLVHSLGLLAVSLALRHAPDSRPIIWAAWLMLTGILLFSGSLYLLSVTGISGFAFLPPLGGIAFILAWVLLAGGTWKKW
ncbi:MAG: DUF423 domain-containing protein [Desulfovibrionales bacterium]